MPCSHGNRTPREIHEAAVAAATNCDSKVMMLFGRTGEEILKALEFYNGRCYDPKCPANQEQTKMTREEAITKVENSILNDVPLSTAVKSADMHIRVLEALGLLKFDEPKAKINNDLLKAVKECRCCYASDTEFVFELEKKGYVILCKSEM